MEYKSCTTCSLKYKRSNYCNHWLKKRNLAGNHEYYCQQGKITMKFNFWKTNKSEEHISRRKTSFCEAACRNSYQPEFLNLIVLTKNSRWVNWQILMLVIALVKRMRFKIPSKSSQMNKVFPILSREKNIQHNWFSRLQKGNQTRKI